MSTCFEDAVRMAVSLGADADTLGAIVGSIAEAIWGIPLGLRGQIEDYLPDDMQQVLRQFYRKRPQSFKPLIDTTFYKKDYSDAAWDLLDDEERKELRDIVEKNKDKKRELMAERGRARLNW
jgi:hypothetical protein